MRKKVLLTIASIVTVLLSGCSNSYTATEIFNIDSEDVTTWNTKSIRFVPIDKYTLKDGSINGMDFVTFVDLENGVMYLYTEKYRSGYGTTWEPIYNKDGTLSVYENLDTLRIKNDWVE